MIRYERFSKRFGAHAAVTDLTLEVSTGETVALLGPNGSGKTTSLKAGAGLVRPTGGRVTIGDARAPASTAAARRLCAFLPQKVAFPEALTGREVVDFYRRFRGVSPARAGDVLRLASLNGASDRAVVTYSGGMVQRLGLAVAVLADVPVLLLDEPTAALDPEGLALFYRLIEQRKAERRAVLFSSHRLGDAERLADRFAILIGGRLAAAFGQQELSRRLADRSSMRVAVVSCPAGALAGLEALGARATWDAERHEVVVPGPASRRPAALDAIRNAGGEILAITSEEGRLDTLYSDLVAGAAEERP